MGIRDFFTKKKPSSANLRFVNHPNPRPVALPESPEEVTPELIAHLTKWVIEVFDPEAPQNFKDLMTVEPATMTGPYDDPVIALELLDKAVETLNRSRQPGDEYTGRLRPIITHPMG